jgi:hypothetical protein
MGQARGAKDFTLDSAHNLCDIIGMTDFLFARPSVIEGIGRNVDLFGVLNNYNFSRFGAEADRKAFYSDWLMVYEDLFKAYQDTICQIEPRKTAE